MEKEMLGIPFNKRIITCKQQKIIKGEITHGLRDNCTPAIAGKILTRYILNTGWKSEKGILLEEQVLKFVLLRKRSATSLSTIHV